MFKASTSIASRVASRACHEDVALRGFRALTTSTTSSTQGLRGQHRFGVQHSTVRGSMTGFGSGFVDSMGPSATSLPSNITLNGLVMTDETYIPVTQAGRLLMGKSEEVEESSRRRKDRSQPRRRVF
mmetsp:Transcript_60482/g.132395  ORF Transcript_60482/g.132395 Transcript_60482/m.132395 type:complete len:127 (-) Transcript_60482:145-525(-)|eukprot:CAMPEP_0206467128 /NCGR_PEP_ID=MMETSP0324_2-20121206/28864_1 /ASSEMBLY_ACC=CAM_ASM_000836 /TAXON_ID=2866 /ORGANISM="Crypthecodinium cohnii, Strain Seligo" /LENGTH=126 /DNA_ID=CAMNT_0053940365 /DNA_START=42 /DNA_END=422 /DNA_ORIENTATION=+